MWIITWSCTIKIVITSDLSQVAIECNRCFSVKGKNMNEKSRSQVAAQTSPQQKSRWNNNNCNKNWVKCGIKYNTYNEWKIHCKQIAHYNLFLVHLGLVQFYAFVQSASHCIHLHCIVNMFKQFCLLTNGYCKCVRSNTCLENNWEIYIFSFNYFVYFPCCMPTTAASTIQTVSNLWKLHHCMGQLWKQRFLTFSPRFNSLYVNPSRQK